MEPDRNKTPGAPARKKQHVSSSARKRRQSLSPVARFTGIAIVAALALTTAAGYWGHQAWVQQNRAMQLQTLTREHAHSTAAAVEERLRRYQRQLREFAASPRVVAAFAESDTPAPETELKVLFPSATHIRALPAGAARAHATSQTDLRFAELDMIARAEKRQDVFPEAAREEDRWLLKLVTPVPSDTDLAVTGTLLVSLPMEVLLPVLEQGNQHLGRVNLEQVFPGNQPLQVLSTGAGQAGDAQTAVIPNTFWQVRFTPSAQLQQQAQVSLALPLASLAAFALAALAVAIVLGRWLGVRAQGSQRVPTAAQGTLDGAKTGADYSPDDILDIDITDEDEALLGLEEREIATTATPPTMEVHEPVRAADVPAVIFRAYDIRGLAETEITADLAQQIGQALGSEALDHGQNALIVARDARTHSPMLMDNLIKGILSTGCGVINIGAVPTPLMYFATETLPQTQSGVVVTASHNGREYNGFKVVITGKSRSAEDIQNIRKRILAGNFYSGRGQEEHVDIVPHYIDTIFSDVALAGEMHIVLDAGNGITAQVAPRLFEELGCRVTPLFCELDGTFPNHAPDPSVTDNLSALVERVQAEKADLGVAFDGDGDRLAVVTPKGDIVWADKLLLLFAKDIVARNPGADVVFDVKSTRQLGAAISSFGGRPVMWKTGHAPMRTKMLETGALVGAEFSGHVFIKDRWFGFDDGIYAAARLIEIISLRGEDLDSMLAEFPPTHITPEILIPIAEDKKFAIVRQLQESGDFGEARVTTLDGLRADYPHSWGLVRASNTSANLTLRFEADTQEDLRHVKALFARELAKLDESLSFS